MPLTAYNNLVEQLSLMTYEQLANMMHITIDLMKEKKSSEISKREIGKYDNQVEIKFADEWEMTEEELCSL